MAGGGASVLSRHLKILAAFDMDSAHLSLSQIARRTEMPVSTVHRMLGALEDEGLVERSGTHTFRLGIRLWELACRTPGALGLREIARPFMQGVQNVVRQHTQLGVMSEYDVIFIERLSAREAVVNATLIGGRIPLPASSSGHVLLAEMDEEFVGRLVEAGSPAFTSRTPTTSEEILPILDEVRRRGYAVGSGLVHSDARGIAVPIRDQDGRTAAALGVVVANDDKPVEPAVEVLQHAASGISRTLRASSLPPGHPHALPGAKYRALVNSSVRSMEYLDSPENMNQRDWCSRSEERGLPHRGHRPAGRPSRADAPGETVFEPLGRPGR